MDRIIKFRGKDKDTEKWVYGFYLGQDIYNMGSKNTKRDLLIKNAGVIVQNSKFDSGTVVDKKTLGQFTGLYDKNGKEIFEGDIVKSYFENGLGVENKCLIIYDEYLCAFMGQELRTKQQYLFNEGNPNKKDKQLKYTEVIGNMYDKPVTKEQFEEIGYKIEGE